MLSPLKRFYWDSLTIYIAPKNGIIRKGSITFTLV